MTDSGAGDSVAVAPGEGLPEGWGRATIRELCAAVAKVQPDELDRATFQYVDIGSIASDEFVVSAAKEITVRAAPSRARQLIQAGDTVFSTVRPYLKKIAWIPESLDGEIASTGFCVLRPGAALDSRFLFHLVTSDDFVVRITEKQRGVSYPAVREVDILEEEIWVPPLPEQRRIAAKLDEQLAHIEAGEAAARTALASSEILRDRITGEGACGGLDGAELFPAELEKADADDGVLPNLPLGWRWARLGEIAAVAGGVTKDSKKQSDPDYVEVPYLRVANVQRGRLVLDRIEKIRVPAVKADALRLVKGDVLLNEGGDRDKLGRGWIWEEQIEDCIHQNHVFRARVVNDIIDPLLLAWHANSFGKSWCDRNGKQTVNLASISLRKIKLLPVPVPPREVQAELVKVIQSHVAEAAAAHQLAQGALAQASELRGALLHAAFTGALVPQDPSDEPAAVLLDRIRAQRLPAVRPVRKRVPRKTTPPGQEELPQ
ncbi:restriction endonuclease subunit S [Streptomyces nojiriensis]|uniref:restriction endonuclease subunit S n=1 Tax=Streptomyces nojiriensis TaxID=66374 RepID=UPI0036C1E48A